MATTDIKKVLIPADAPDRQRLEQVLHGDGWEIRPYRDVSEAEREVRDAPCQAVVLRHGEDGIASMELVKKIRDVRPETFVLGVGSTNPGEADAVLDAQPSPRELLAVLRVGQTVHRAREAEQRLREQLRQAEALALRDELTQLYNRRYFFQALAQQMERSLRDGSGFAIVMMDIDHFKQFNDTYGHIAGDELLRELAKTLLKTFRRMDTVARYGGEEFIALMPEAPSKKATSFDPVSWMERVRAAVEETVRPVRNIPEGHRITISAGVVIYPQDGKELDALIAEVDARLYRAKAAGRNRVCATPQKPAAV